MRIFLEKDFTLWYNKKKITKGVGYEERSSYT